MTALLMLFSTVYPAGSTVAALAFLILVNVGVWVHSIFSRDVSRWNW